MTTTDPGLAPSPDQPAPEQPAPEGRRRRRRLIAMLVLLLVALLVVGSLFAWYLVTRKPLTALPGLDREQVPSYAYSIYGVSHPLAVAVTPDGQKVYVSQAGGDRKVKIFDHSGRQIGTLTPPASTGAAHVPVYLALNPANGEVYVTDRVTSAVYVYDAANRYLRTVKPPADVGSWAPLGVALDADGALYVSDVRGSAHRIVVLEPDGRLRSARTVPDGLSFPNGLVAGPAGRLVVADSNNGRVLVVDKGWNVVGAIKRGVGEGDLGLPRGVAFDDSDRLFVVDTTNQQVKVYRLTGSSTTPVTFVGAFGEEGQADGLFEYPNGVATDTRSNIYVADRENNRVQVWRY